MIWPSRFLKRKVGCLGDFARLILVLTVVMFIVVMFIYFSIVLGHLFIQLHVFEKANSSTTMPSS